LSTVALAREKPPAQRSLKAEPNPVRLPFRSPAGPDCGWSAAAEGVPYAAGPNSPGQAGGGLAVAGSGTSPEAGAGATGRRSGADESVFVAAAWSARSAASRITSCSSARFRASSGDNGIRSPYTAARLPTMCASTIGRCAGVDPAPDAPTSPAPAAPATTAPPSAHRPQSGTPGAPTSASTPASPIPQTRPPGAPPSADSPYHQRGSRVPSPTAATPKANAADPADPQRAP
jgi:hypothetical protein